MKSMGLKRIESSYDIACCQMEAREIHARVKKRKTFLDPCKNIESSYDIACFNWIGSKSKQQHQKASF